jgi:hypothetical protein
MPLCFLQYTALPTCCNWGPFLFRVYVGWCPSPTLCWSMPHFSCCYKPSPLQTHWGRCCHSCLLLPACLFTVLWGSAPALLSGAQGTPPSLLCVFFFSFSAACLLFSLFFSSFFPGWGSVCPGGYADLAQGCLWEYCVPLSSPGVLLFPSWLGAGIWRCGSPPGFSV